MVNFIIPYLVRTHLCFRNKKCWIYAACGVLQTPMIRRKERLQGVDIIKKENEILEKLKESGYSTFGGDKEKALDYLEEQLMKVLMYDEEEIREQIGKRGSKDSSGEQESLSRETKYERRASGLEALNKICADLGLTPFADIDTGNMQAL